MPVLTNYHKASDTQRTTGRIIFQNRSTTCRVAGKGGDQPGPPKGHADSRFNVTSSWSNMFTHFLGLHKG